MLSGVWGSRVQCFRLIRQCDGIGASIGVATVVRTSLCIS